MSKLNINNKGKTVVALASLAGIALVSSNGLYNHLTRVFDSVAISSAQAQTSPNPAPQVQPEIIPLDLLLQQSGANSVVIKNGNAVGVFDDGREIPLADGDYSGEGIMFTVENMTVTSCEGCDEDMDGESLSAEYCIGGSCDEHTESDITPQEDIFSPTSPTENPTSPTPLPPASEQSPMDEPSPSVEPINPSPSPF